MFDKSVIHDIVMLCLEKSGKREPIDLARFYKQVHKQIVTELNNEEPIVDDEEPLEEIYNPYQR